MHVRAICCNRDLVVGGLDPAHGVVEEGDEVAGDAGDDGVDHAGHHERVVQQVLADDGGSRAVEVHRGESVGQVAPQLLVIGYQSRFHCRKRLAVDLLCKSKPTATMVKRQQNQPFILRPFPLFVLLFISAVFAVQQGQFSSVGQLFAECFNLIGHNAFQFFLRNN